MAIGTPTVGTQVEAAAATSTTVSYPATVNAGDLMLLMGSIQNLSTADPQTPSGWTSIGIVATNAIAPNDFAFWKYAAGTEGGTTLAVSHTGASNVNLMQILAFSGVDQVTPLDVTSQSLDGTAAASLSQVFSGLTLVSTGCTVVYTCAINTTTDTATPPAGYTETADRSSGTRSATIGYIQGLASGATGTVTVTWAATSARSCGWLIALRPAAVGGGTQPLVVPGLAAIQASNF